MLAHLKSQYSSIVAFADLNALEFFDKQGFTEVDATSQQYSDLLRVIERCDESLLMAFNLPSFSVTAKIQIIERPHRELVGLFDSASYSKDKMRIHLDDKKQLIDTVNDFKGAIVAFESSLAMHRARRDQKKKS